MIPNEISSSTPLKSEKIRLLLKHEPKKYKVIENDSSSPLLDWWTTFGYPAALDENNVFQRITGYVSCFKCFGTFVYGNNSGTTRLKQHAVKCSKAACSSSITIESSDLLLRQSTLARHGFKKTIKLNENDLDNIKKLSALWVCQDTRPFSTLEDVGLRALAHELTSAPEVKAGG
ncbi:unnamed protein product, partial [Rotaria magnacalcarata]